MEKIILTPQIGKQIHFIAANGKWQAVCESINLPICSHIGTCFGDERDSQKEAQDDVDKHKLKCPNHDPEVIQW